MEHRIELMPQPAAAIVARVERPGGGLYLQALTWAFTFFNSLRVFAYLPTLWAIYLSGDSSQHSLLTWLCWFCANATMAAWMHQNNGQRINKAIAFSMCNATMCLAASVLIVYYRLV